MVLIPVAGLTLRFALKPVVSVIDRYLRGHEKAEATKLSDRRLAMLEEQLDDVQNSLTRLLDGREFDARLKGKPQPRLSTGSERAPAGEADAE